MRVGFIIVPHWKPANVPTDSINLFDIFTQHSLELNRAVIVSHVGAALLCITQGDTRNPGKKAYSEFVCGLRGTGSQA